MPEPDHDRTPQTSARSSRKTIGAVLGWAVGAVFILAGIGGLAEQPLPASMLLLAGAVSLPPLRSLLSSRLGLRMRPVTTVVVVLGFFFVGAATFRKDTDNDSSDHAQARDDRQPSEVPVPLASELVHGDQFVQATISREKCAAGWWPLAVDTAELRAERLGPMPHAEAALTAFLVGRDGQWFALNGVARGNANLYGWKDIQGSGLLSNEHDPSSPLSSWAARIETKHFGSPLFTGPVPEKVFETDGYCFHAWQLLAREAERRVGFKKGVNVVRLDDSKAEYTGNRSYRVPRIQAELVSLETGDVVKRQAFSGQVTLALQSPRDPVSLTLTPVQ